ncbi:uncharacterized protein LOC113549527 [Rhopalosiphum maidis]|uniref:uncharacterized protein LOC113549527 n=1 Tax=Rhopalosiphum maidis TaxID=43146 RepID=UPI000EFE28C9|nr:uncharacterized protein LOC113549527 [Rhopalosiphum maidis]
MVYYFYKTQAEWTTMLEYESSNGGSNFSNEMKGLKTFLDQHPKISGLILSELQYDYTSIEYPKFTENFKKYLEAMRGCFPDLVIALSLYGSSLIDQYIFPALKWLNIKKIDSYLDFYTVDLVAFNRCTDEFKNIGTAPMSASDTNYTLDNIKEALKLGGFPKEKTYFKFRISPSSADESLNAWILNVEQMCLYPNQTSNWCADTQSSFNEKGQFACTNGVGFMVHYIDFNDPHNCCRCEKPYPSFNAILDGWKGVDTKPCNSLTRL